MAADHPLFAEYYAKGKARRQICHRVDQAEVVLAPGRDPVAVLAASSQGRVPELIPLRYGRMQASPFAFFRGMAMMQAADLANRPSSGIVLQLCGDAHLMNYGFYASPERNLVFDINDFDETHPGPWEWDVKRLAVSLVLAARSRGFSEVAAAEAVRLAVRTYRHRTHHFACMGQMDIWYSRISYGDLLDMAQDPALRETLLKLAERARNRTSERLLPKITADENGLLRLKDNPPVLFHTGDTTLIRSVTWPAGSDWREQAEAMLQTYIGTLKEDRAELARRFRLVDLAFKVVGVGSVGTRCLVALLQDSYDTPLFLQLKEARASVLEPFTQGCIHGNQGKRVVFGQRLMQAASDLFLGWTRGPDGCDYYVRQLRDMKVTIAAEDFSVETLTAYGQACAWALARAHSKSGGRAAEIAGYLGQTSRFEDALALYATRYADQAEADYESFRRAVRDGVLPASD
ncbi:DUF2252 domain-containing protein [Paludibacterium yongneupense]|uniref:DUF2252 domain-containing protein n=1 Tax=Paludibacterium yongneupense TaxID=400061 RepID=UPI0003FAB6B0|nr:DUF2252 domain-containing protein [Paludibacterium yongneupense]